MFARFVFAVVLIGGLAACSGATSSAVGARPSTTARLSILAPTPGEVVSGDVQVRLRLTGGRIVPVGVTTGLLPNEGHVHLYVDGRLVSMVASLAPVVPGLSAGQHLLRAEFVANDHLPFQNRMVVAVLFRVA